MYKEKNPRVFIENDVYKEKNPRVFIENDVYKEKNPRVFIETMCTRKRILAFSLKTISRVDEASVSLSSIV